MRFRRGGELTGNSRLGHDVEVSDAVQVSAPVASELLSTRWF